MAMTQPAIADVANAYRATLAEGDKALSGSLERRILVALVTESADKTATWIESRVENGSELAKPVREFNQSAAKGDTLGRVIAATSQRLFAEARSALFAVVFAGTTPAWILTVAGFVGGFFGFAKAFGAVVGFGLAGILAAGWSARVAYMAVRSAQMAAAANPGKEVIATLESAQSVGSTAMRIFQENAAPAVERLYETANARPQQPTTVKKLRGVAVAIWFIAWGAAAVAILFFLAGLAEGFAAYQAQNPTLPSYP